MYILEKGLSYQRLILVVQKKSDCLVSETRLSSFHGFKPHWTELTPSPFFLTSLSHTRTTMRVTSRPPLAIPWFLHGILEFLGEINSPRTGVSVPPTGFPHLKVFSPNPRSLCLMDGFEIPLVHCLHSCYRTIPCNISKFPWLNRSDS
jgi:hypothetical protein